MQVSVIMPVYNAQEFLASAIQSVLGQTHQDFELIAMDDGSSDQSLDILEQFARQDSRVLVGHQRNRGVGLTINECLARAKNDLVLRFDADDLMVPNRLERQVWFMERHQELSVATSYAWLIDRQNRLLAEARPVVDIERGIRLLDPGYFVELVTPSTIMRRQHIKAIGPYQGNYREIAPLEDRELWGRLVASGYRIGVQAEFLLKQRLHRSSLTAKTCLQNIIVGEFVDLNTIRALQGKPALPFESFMHRRRSASFLARLARDTHELGSACYRQATRDFAERDWWRLLGHGISAVCLRPNVAGLMFGKLVRTDRRVFSAFSRKTKTAAGRPC
jgi:glycosyltransferase involved in cell wall biosynthesis